MSGVQGPARGLGRSCRHVSEQAAETGLKGGGYREGREVKGLKARDWRQRAGGLHQVRVWRKWRHVSGEAAGTGLQGGD